MVTILLAEIESMSAVTAPVSDTAFMIKEKRRGGHGGNGDTTKFGSGFLT